MLNVDILSGDYDKNYDYFLSDRADLILNAIHKNITEAKAGILKQFGDG